MGDNLYSSRKTSEAVPGKLWSYFEFMDVSVYARIQRYSTDVAVLDVIILKFFLSASVASLPRYMSPCHLRGGYLCYIMEVEKDASSVKLSEGGCPVALFL